MNLEHSLRADDEFGGHFVTGHVDGPGKIIRWERAGKDHVLDIATSTDAMRYVVHKGSIAVDGISLTIAAVRKKIFASGSFRTRLRSRPCTKEKLAMW